MTDFGWTVFTPPEQVIGEALGAASMCWDPPPTGAFQSEKASEIIDAVLKIFGDKQKQQRS